ncbi:DNA recombination protein RmuC [Porphyromonas loveana]|uniref:DNA recombination protein RmuC n=3 Tax=Porphyromonas loveana TaxID=1884669 RepID=A0A2U1F0T5_9PORP|nr:DNA recombination protein RmuC [Porphyromonas loveana]PVZ05739.1 DNA recombination protein RmuC [Porphyromonas loveana]
MVGVELYWIVAVVVVAAAVIVWLSGRKQAAERRLENERSNMEMGRLTAQLDAATREKTALQEEQKESIRIRAELETRLQATRAELERERERAGQISEEMQALFKATASEILEDKSKKLSGVNEQRIGEILKPLNERIKQFEEKVEKTYHEEARERFSLAKELQRLIEQNSRLSDDANNLTRALKGDSKVQGDWGEMILENLLRRSGLTEGEEFFIQETMTDEEGRALRHDETGSRMRPDVIVRYPNGQQVIIDSKVSLTAYASFVAAEDDAERKHWLEEHIASIRRHIDELASKSYQDYSEEAPEFVMLFIPNEPAYTIALRERPTLWDHAYSKRVLLMNPTNLIAALRMALDLWQRDRQVKNIQKIVDQANGLYDKFCTFAETLIRAEEQAKNTVDTLAKARGQLSEGRGNIVTRVEKMRSLGISPKKKMPLSLQSESEDDTENE